MLVIHTMVGHIETMAVVQHPEAVMLALSHPHTRERRMQDQKWYFRASSFEADLHTTKTPST